MGKRQATGHGRTSGTGRPLDGALLVPIGHIRASTAQPRRTFARRPLEGLASSIRERGILQPLRVRPDPRAPGRYVLVVGERRLHAAALAGLAEVPVIVCPLAPDEALLDALAENVARVNLLDGELVEAYRLLRGRGNSDRRIAAGIGVAHTTIGRLLRVADDALLGEAVEAGHLTMSFAWELLPLDEEAKAAIVALIEERREAGTPVRVAELRALLEPLRQSPVTPTSGVGAANPASGAASPNGWQIEGDAGGGVAADAGSPARPSTEQVALDEARAAGWARALRRYVEHHLAALGPFARQGLVAEDLRAILGLLLALYPEAVVDPARCADPGGRLSASMAAARPAVAPTS